MTGSNPAEHARRLANESLAVDDATGWFERLYVAAAERGVAVPWDRGAPHVLLRRWAGAGVREGEGQRALVVGCGLGEDAELVARLGFETVAFDVATTAVRMAQSRFPDSRVRYVTADLLDPPRQWLEAFDLVVESLTVQSLPVRLRSAATRQVRSMVRPSGTLVVIATARDEEDDPAGPPWPLTRTEIMAFAGDGLRSVAIEKIPDAADPTVHRWRAEFRRSAPDG